jgi:hypothetical protein
VQAPCRHVLPARRILRPRPVPDPAVARPRPRNAPESASRASFIRSLGDLRSGGPEVATHARCRDRAGAKWPAHSTVTKDLGRFWVEPVPLPERPSTLDVEPGLLLRQLPVPAAELGGERLTTGCAPRTSGSAPRRPMATTGECSRARRHQHRERPDASLWLSATMVGTATFGT